MKTILVFCIVLLGLTSVYAQDQSGPVDTNKVFTFVQKQAKFPGSINTWLAENMVYPPEAKNNNIQGTVYVTFIVEKDGSVSTVKILRGAYSILNDEAVRVISMMPKWEPGMQNGHTIRQLCNVPIHFKLTDETTGDGGNSANNDNISQPSMAVDNNDNKIYTIVQQQPKFQGDVTSWLSENIVYPKEAKDKKIEGTVFISFVVEKDGSPSAIKVMRGVEGGNMLNDEALRVVSMMPKWTPGVQNGVAVRTQYMLPVHFTLTDNSQTQNNSQSGSNNNTTHNYSNQQSAESANGQTIWVDEKPEFHGNLLKYLADNIHYPEALKSKKTEGSVSVSFVVGTDGSVTGTRIDKKDPGRTEMEQEALRVINAMPKWKPAIQNGTPIAERIYLAIPFFMNVDE